MSIKSETIDYRVNQPRSSGSARGVLKFVNTPPDKQPPTDDEDRQLEEVVTRRASKKLRQIPGLSPHGALADSIYDYEIKRAKRLNDASNASRVPEMPHYTEESED